MTDASDRDPGQLTVAELTRGLADHLQATEERPIDPKTNRWLGEAEAVATDLVGTDVAASVAADRAATVVELLDHVDSLDDQVATEHVDIAKSLAGELATRG